MVAVQARLDVQRWSDEVERGGRVYHVLVYEAVRICRSQASSLGLSTQKQARGGLRGAAPLAITTCEVD